MAGGAIMAKIISGGLIGSSARTQANYTPQQSQQQEPEGWGGYAARNIGGTGEGFLKGIEALGSLFTPSQEHQKQQRQSQIEGLQRINRILQERGDQPFTNFPTNEQQLQQTLPSDVYLGALNKGESFGAPKNLTESALRFGLTEAPFIVASGGFSSLPAFGKAAAGSLGMLAGSQAGHAIGESIGGEKGGVVGGLAGGIGGSVLTHGLLNKPSKLYNKIKEAEVEKTLKGIQGVSGEHAKKLKEAAVERNASIQKLRENKILREKRIKELGEGRTPIYNKAYENVGSIAEPAHGLQAILYDVKENVKRGVEKSEQARVKSMVKGIEHHIDRETGELALKDAIQIQKNLNTKLSRAKAFGQEALPNVVENKYKQIVKGVNEFIEEVGQNYPEFGEPFKQAEAQTREFKTLINKNKEFAQQQREQLRDIKQNYSDTVKSVKAEYTPAGRLKNTLIKGASNYGAAAIGSVILKGLGVGNASTVLSGLGIKLGQSLVNETKIINNLFKEHPQVYHDYVTALKDYVKTESPKSLTKLKALNNKVDSMLEEKKPQKGNRIISGGLK